jgi:hypothetical protein
LSNPLARIGRRLARGRAWKLVLLVDILAAVAILIGGLFTDFFETTLGLILVLTGAGLLVAGLAYTRRWRSL